MGKKKRISISIANLSNKNMVHASPLGVKR